MTQRLKKQYVETIVPKLMQQFQYKNIHQTPKLTKIVINRGVSNPTPDSVSSLITGQKGVITLSKKSIASFKIRENMPVGVTVTLRGARMYDFLDRLINLALPRVRNFQGVSTKSFDNRGNYTLGLNEQLIFPEITLDTVHGMDITIVTTARNPEEGKALLKEFGFPFNR